eukprot:gb/GECG01009169.1/.p1 GENE.gb/GECG01009169.1/~~gb/GECG01009169.1/.p1  ORF type:complete len:318 (+),score=27.27 gb/GECG01009169.1/:1-954(+)
MAGFQRAPVTKTAFVLSGGFSLVAWLKNVQATSVALSPASILGDFQIWRIFTSQLVVKSPGEMIIFAYLLYEFRHMERLMGSNKFSVFTLLCTLTSSTLQLGLLLATTGMVSNVRPGPYSLLFALFVYYFKSVPKVRPNQISVFGIGLSEKTFTYLLGAVLLFNKGTESVIPGVSGLVFGLMFFADVFRMRKWRWPSRVHKWCERNIMPFVDSVTPNRRPAARQHYGQMGTNHAPAVQTGETEWPAPRQNVTEQPQEDARQQENTPVEEDVSQIPRATPDESKVQQLMQMGFEREAIEEALAATDNNEEAAVHRLIQ